MADIGSKKVKIYNVAKELNISSETIIEFLRKKGFEVKSHMSPVTDEMLSLIHTHFKKDKDLAERHQRKLQELKLSKKKDISKEVPQSKKEITKEAPKEVKLPQTEKKEEVPIEIVQPLSSELAKEQFSIPDEHNVHTEVPETYLEKSINNEKSVAEPVSVEQVAAPTESQLVEQTEEIHVHTLQEELKEELSKEIEPVEIDKKDEEKNEEKKEIALTPLEIVARQQRGLTIKGKIDLARPTVPAEQIKQEDEEKEKKKKKKKKKKIIQEQKRVKEEPIIDEEEVKSKKRKKLRRVEVDEVEVERAIRETLAEIEEGDVVITRAAIRKKKKEKREEEQQRLLEKIEREKTNLRVTEFLTVGELANMMNVPVAQVIQKIMNLGMMVSINQRIDKDTITLVADEFGYQVEFQDVFAEDLLIDREDLPEELQPRPPVVTIMGHVDHGKTSLLDYIRNTNVVAGEAGGITQHIGAYEVTLPGGKQITFLDTPGHEAFTAMRARGAQITDIVVLVVAADDSVMPQTVEAISHAQAASVPIVVAINKIDKPEANPEKIKQQLAEKGLLVEDYGGKAQVVEISAKTGKNVDLLLEKILLEAEMLELRANPNRPARGTVIEAELDRGKGITATILVRKGTLRVGDPFICGIWSGRVRAMFDEREQKVLEAGPSKPVQVIGFDGIPQAGDELIVLADEREAREISMKRQQLKREQDFRQARRLTLDEISKQIKEGEVRDLPIIVKADVDGSAEAIADSLMKLSTKEVAVRVIHKGVGGISESDVLLALASNAIIIGFHVRPHLKARQLAQAENVDIRLYNIIYDAINDVKSALEGMLKPKITEEILATVEVREIFRISKVGTVAGCYVKDGKIARNNKVRLIRDGIEIYNGTLASLKRFKDDVREVEQGFECGIMLDNYNDIKVGDIIEAYKLVEVKRTLE
ncbi:MAG: translation initiation factor IF-2 [Bacteroidetes bacterium]|nr:translation initiation factor IF-2 [Bacteroidota bacterium]